MIKAIIGNNASRSAYNMEESKTIREALETADVDYSRGMISLDGSTVSPGDLNKTFYELGYTGEPGKDKCVLTVLAKLDNA